MDEAERCTRIGLLFKGRLIERGTPREIKAMVKGQVIEFHPDRLEAARALLARQPGVLEVQVYGTLLHVFVEEADRTWPRSATNRGIQSNIHWPACGSLYKTAPRFCPCKNGIRPALRDGIESLTYFIRRTELDLFTSRFKGQGF